MVSELMLPWHATTLSDVPAAAVGPTVLRRLRTADEWPAAADEWPAAAACDGNPSWLRSHISLVAARRLASRRWRCPALPVDSPGLLVVAAGGRACATPAYQAARL